MARTDHLVRLVFVAAAGAATAGCTDAADPSDGSGAPAGVVRPVSDDTVRANLHQVALGLAKRAGVAAPASMIAVGAADHQTVEALVSGAILDDHAPVYVVQMTGGTFTSTHHPHGRPAPQGTVLTVTFDAATLRVTDIGYDTIAPDLKKIEARPIDLLATATRY
jgi:hypothetical protein